MKKFALILTKIKNRQKLQIRTVQSSLQMCKSDDSARSAWSVSQMCECTYNRYQLQKPDLKTETEREAEQKRTNKNTKQQL